MGRKKLKQKLDLSEFTNVAAVYAAKACSKPGAATGDWAFSYNANAYILAHEAGHAWFDLQHANSELVEGEDLEYGDRGNVMGANSAFHSLNPEQQRRIGVTQYKIKEVKRNGKYLIQRTGGSTKMPHALRVVDENDPNTSYYISYKPLVPVTETVDDSNMYYDYFGGVVVHRANTANVYSPQYFLGSLTIPYPDGNMLPDWVEFVREVNSDVVMVRINKPTFPSRK
ncbi:MAG: hypothetical protein HC836_40470 [Richelia sp. RM2_1_2]|nr:hypothetical protein [Richelia sp. RM2_1_2]